MNDWASSEQNTDPTRPPVHHLPRPHRFGAVFWGLVVLLGALFIGNAMDSDKKFTWGCAVRSLIGVGLLGVGLFSVWGFASFLPGVVTTQGTIFSCTDHQDNNRRLTCIPHVSFQTASGERREFTGPRGDWGAGERQTVWYHPEHPSDARLGTWLPVESLLGGSVLLLVGLLFVSFAFFSPQIARLYSKHYPL